MPQAINLDSENVYEVTVSGEIAPSWLTGFGAVDGQPVRIEGEDDQSTRFKIVTDQAGLVGLIRRLHGLGVVLVSVRPVPGANNGSDMSAI